MVKCIYFRPDSCVNWMLEWTSYIIHAHTHKCICMQHRYFCRLRGLMYKTWAPSLDCSLVWMESFWARQLSCMQLRSSQTCFDCCRELIVADCCWLATDQDVVLCCFIQLAAWLESLSVAAWTDKQIFLAQNQFFILKLLKCISDVLTLKLFGLNLPSSLNYDSLSLVDVFFQHNFGKNIWVLYVSLPMKPF